MRLALPLTIAALTLGCVAPRAVAQDAATSYRLEGHDTARGPFVGSLAVTRGAPGGPSPITLRLTFAGGAEASWSGVATGSGERLQASLRDGAGIAALGAAGHASRAQLAVRFGLQGGACQGSLTTSRGVASFRGQRPGATTPAGPAYEAGAPEAKQAAVFAEASAVPYGELPRVGSRGAGANAWDSLRALRTRLLEPTFAETTDARPPRSKIFHAFGSVAQVRYEALPGHAYTGLFATGGVGLARLSLAIDEATYVPGIALKLFVAGRPSVNVHAIPSFDGQASRDFFARAPSNEIPPPSGAAVRLLARVIARVADPLRRPVDHVAAVTPDGAPVSSPCAPRRIHFRPAEVHFPADAQEDFRALLATIPVGSVIYEVWAETPSGEVRIGRVRTTSPFVASAWGDQVLHFHHAR